MLRARARVSLPPKFRQGFLKSSLGHFGRAEQADLARLLGRFQSPDVRRPQAARLPLGFRPSKENPSKGESKGESEVS